MVLAALWHLPLGESIHITMNIVFVVVVAFVAYGRWPLCPFEG